MRPPLAASHWARLAGVSLTACSNSVLATLERWTCGRLIEQTEVPPPVFIIGHWRSGTTLLHNLMSLDRQLVSPNLYQAVFPGHFLLTERVLGPLTAWLLPSKRTFDDVPVTGWNTPQEDEIALCLLSLLSPYLMLAFPDDPEAYWRYLALETVPRETRDRWKEVFVRFLKKVMIDHSGQRPLLKSPTHSFRIPLLLELFPQAKFVHIVRDPYRVIASTLHLRRVAFVDNALAPPTFETLEEDALALYESCFEHLENDLQLLEPGQVHELRLEDIEVDIPGELARIYESLALPGFAELEQAVAPQLPSLYRHQKNSLELAEPLQRKIEDRCGPVFDRYGYALRSARVERPAAAAIS